jgi:hypothetical protein
VDLDGRNKPLQEEARAFVGGMCASVGWKLLGKQTAEATLSLHSAVSEMKQVTTQGRERGEKD